MQESKGHRVVVEPLLQETFAPFGDVLTLENLDRLPIDFYGDRVDIFRPAPFESDQPVEWLVSRSRIREFRVQFMERHRQLTQTFIPLAGHPFVAVLARPGAQEEDGIPSLHEIHAFLVPGDRGINIHRGTWHELPFPLIDGGLQLITSHQRLTVALQGNLDQRREVEQLPLDLEKRNVTERSGKVLRVEFP